MSKEDEEKIPLAEKKYKIFLNELYDECERMIYLLYNLGHYSSKKIKKEEQSEDWQYFYKRFEEKIITALRYDQYLFNLRYKPFVELSEEEIKVVIYNAVLYYVPSPHSSFQHYVIKCLMRKATEPYRNKKIVELSFNDEFSYKNEFDDGVYSDSDITISRSYEFETEESKGFEIVNATYDSYEDTHDLQRVEEENRDIRVRDLIFTLLEEKYNQTKSGQNLKKQVYTYMVIEYLLSVPLNIFRMMCNTYTFLNVTASKHYRIEKIKFEREKKLNKKLRKKEFTVKQQDFAKFTNTHTDAYSEQRKKALDYITSNEQMIALKNLCIR